MERDFELSTQHLYEIQRTENLITPKDFKKNFSDCSKRIASLGEELWKENILFQELEEKAGLKPELSINVSVEIAFKYLYSLLTLYKDDRSDRRSSTVQAESRKMAIKDYESDSGAPSGKLWCPILQRFKAAQIVPKRL